MSVYEDLSTFVQQGRVNNVKEIIAAELGKGTNAQALSLIHILFVPQSGRTTRKQEHP